MPDVLPENWPLWVIVLMIMVRLFQKELSSILSGFIPTGIRDHFAHRARLRADRQEHQQEIEEASVEALAQHAVNAQLQLIHVNEHLVKFVTGQIDVRLNDLEQSLARLNHVLQSDLAKNTIVHTELSRIVDGMQRQEATMEAIKHLLAALIPKMPVMAEE